MANKKSLLLALIATLFSGCHLYTFDDVSLEDEYAHLIGARYTVNRNLFVYGEDGYEYDKKIEYYLITKGGFDNRFILSKTPLEIGIEIKILQIQKSNNHIFASNKHFIVDVLLKVKKFNRPVRLTFRTFIVEDVKGRIQMNPEYFKKSIPE